MRASVLKCYILRGNYHASLQRLSIELSLASGASRVTELTAELLRDVAELQRRLEGWRPEQSDKARHLFYAAHAKALARLHVQEAHGCDDRHGGSARDPQGGV